MSQYVLLFRGINVGGKHLRSMKRLVPLLDSAGYEQVKSCGQSGNIVLTARSDPEKNITQLIAAEFGISPLILVLSRADLEDAIKANPFPSAAGKTVHFYCCAESPVPDTDRIRTPTADTEAFRLTGHVCYLHAPDGIGRSRLVANTESCLGTSASGRNMHSVLALRNMAQQTGAL